MREKDYYKILGLTEEDKKLPQKEFEEKVKKIFRSESMKHHPDRFANASESERKMHEDRFKEISEAYSVLSDSQKRAQYDMGGEFDPFSGFNPFGRGHGFNPFGGFEDFGGGFGFQQEMPKVGGIIKVSVSITLEDVLNGGEKTISFRRKVYCTNCKREVCPHCHGTGMIKNVSRNGFATYIQQTVCPHCQGSGYIGNGHCNRCGGKGYTEETVSEKITIPKGVETDMQMEYSGKGNDYLGGKGGIRGSLIVRFIVKEHEKFERYGDSLRCDLPLTVEEAFNGCETEVITLNGTKLKVTIPPLTPSGKQFRLTGKGLPNVNNNNAYGQLICVVDYKVPTKPLTSRQKELLNEFYEIEAKK